MISEAVTAPCQLNEQTRMKIPLPGRSAAFRAPTGSNAAQNTGVVKDLEACKKRTVLSLQALNLDIQIRLIKWHYLYKQRICYSNPACPGFCTPDTPL